MQTNHLGHTVQDDFEHFLSYSGLWEETPEVKDKLFKAYDAAWDSMSPPVPHRPKRKYTLELSVQDDTWEGLLHELERLRSHITEHGEDCNLISGGYSGGASVLIDVDPNMTHDKYFEELQVWNKKKAGDGT